MTAPVPRRDSAPASGVAVEQSLGRASDPFWSKVDQSGGPDACWPWTLALTSGGYGAAKWSGRMWRAHRVAWTLVNGVIPDGMFVCHSCDSPPCCNPAHLWLGTNADNLADMAAKGRAGGRSGEANSRAKHSWDQVSEIRRLYAAGRVTQRELAARFSYGERAIRRILRGETWAASASLTPVSAIGTRPALHGAVAAVSPATTSGDHVGPPGVVAADTRLCRKCGVPLEAGTYLRLRHAVRRPRGAVNHYPR